MRPPILFISHDASRTGAPIALLNLLRQFATAHLPFEVLLRDGGELVEDFRALAPVTLWPARRTMPLPAPDGGLWRRLWNRSSFTRAREVGPRQAIVDSYRSRSVALVYSNTVTNGDALDGLSALPVPVITHVHELEYWMSHHEPPETLERTRDRTDLFIAASRAVARDLGSVLDVPRERIAVVHESIDIPELPQEVPRRSTRERAGIPDDAFVVGASGTMDWRKGFDLLAPLARAVHARSAAAPVHWLWVGGDSAGEAAGKLRHDFRRCGLEHRLHLTGTVRATREAFAACDAFVVLSREDAFPLVMLEAASVALPVLCFDAGGGAPEFVRNDAGYVVPYLDLARMAECVAGLCLSPALRRSLGTAARERVVRDHDVRSVAPRILDLIDRVQQGWRP